MAQNAELPLSEPDHYERPLAPLSNLAPGVDVGSDQTITLADSAFLEGTVSDDGLPNSPGALTATWSQLGGPGTVTFGNSSEALTTADFSATGIYVLRLTVNDGDLTNSDDLSVTVIAAPPNTIRIPQDYATIQAGIDAAQDGDLVLVSPGTYVESLYVPKSITLASTFYTTGDESLVDQTVISGPDIDAPTIVVSSDTGPETQIVGFTITDGKDGIKVRGKVSVLNNHFVDVDTDAIDFSSGAAGLVQNNVMENNGDDAVDIDDASVMIEGNVMQANGEGVEIRTQNRSGPRLTIIIRNNLIADSTKTGLQLIDIDPIADTAALLIIDRNLIANNAHSGLSMMDNRQTSDDFVGASLLERIHLFNNTFVGNLYGVTGGDNLIAVNNIFAGTTQVAVKNVDGGSIAAYNLFWNNGTDNLGSNLDMSTTLFADPLLDSDFRLQPGSPAVDAGTAQFVLASGEIVLDLSPSAYFGAAPDLGAYESNLSSGNQRPTVDAGPDQTVTLPDSAPLDGTVGDDGLPDPPGSVTTIWSQVSGPGAVAFGDASAEDTTASFSTAGVYVLRLTANDSELNNSDEVTISVNTVNSAPEANDDSANTTRDRPVTINVAANDTDLNGNLVPASANTTCANGSSGCADPAHGSLVNHGDGTFTYTPDPGYAGPDSFVYEICDTSPLCDTASVTITVFGLHTLYVSSSSGGVAGGVAFDDEDILAFDLSTSTWSMYIDGSDVGLDMDGQDIDAFHINSDGSILLSLAWPDTLPDVGEIDDSDIVRLLPVSTGTSSAGTYEWYFDGSDVGLEDNSEDIDAVGLAPDGRLTISTGGTYTVTDVLGYDEDLLIFTATSLGETTSGSWDLYFDGSDVGLNTTSDEDVNGTWIDANGDIYLTTLGDFAVAGATGDAADIFTCVPGSTGANTICTFSPSWDGSAHGFAGEVVNGFAFDSSVVTVPVPDVVGLPQDDAEAAIAGAGLTVGTVTTTHSDSIPAGNVISQDPIGGIQVVPGAAVNLAVSLGPVSVTVPDVVGLPQDDAEDAIEAAGLTVGTVSTSNSDSVPAGNVISQDPAAGNSVAPGSAVDLVVSLGPAPVTVPDVVGLPQADAEAAIGATGLTVGTVGFENSGSVAAGSVISQDPVGGTQVAPGSAVNLVVSLGPVSVPVPDVVGLPQANAEAAIGAAGLTVGTVTTANSNSVPTGEVISQDPAAGNSVAPGSAIDLVVSLGPASVFIYLPLILR